MVSRSEPCGNTCPLINRLQKELKEAEWKAAQIGGKSEDAKIQDLASDIEVAINSVCSDLEELRSDNKKLREWGSNLLSELESVEKELDKTKEKLGEYE